MVSTEPERVRRSLRAELSERLSTLAPQQFRVLLMLADGKLNKQIAYDLNVSEATVKAHMTAAVRATCVFVWGSVCPGAGR
ncbi:LuxR C-terminal-related transcriptional regulator [Algiphilus sp. W345]|uniref:LuxR C-terminal-related transcriptional regulator n=1 Tax=Banduia mediterranea TaxID=3075609 RepID=A0ABU2WLE6_9GAMM|nr:LuxR C-terminal-related transcriptional regulator [Algiphilus sp. W345]MDT0498449.1 LuxR C-terminal-related transcriptional regulator [Algiphilus sp. W345]